MKQNIGTQKLLEVLLSVFCFDPLNQEFDFQQI